MLLDLYPDIASYTNTQVTNRIVGPMYTITSKIWDARSQALIKGTISHTFRKLSASLSFYLCGEGRAAPSWYMYVLAHANIFVSLNYMNITLYNFPSLHNDERDKKYIDLLAKHDRDMVEIRRIIATKQDRPPLKRRRLNDDELSDDDAPDIRAMSSGDDIDEMDEKHNSDDEPDVRFDDDDDAMIADPLSDDDDDASESDIARPTVSVPRIGGGMIDVPVYSKPRRRLSPEERIAYDNRKILKMKLGPWAQIDMTKMVWRHSKTMGMTQQLWKKYRLL